MSFLPAWGYDAILIAVVLIWTVLGVKRGFIRSLFKAGGWLLSILIAYFVTSPITAMFFDTPSEDSLLLGTILHVIVFLLIFILLTITIHSIGKAIDKIAKALPLVKQANAALGGAMGFVEGVLIVVMLSMVLRLYLLSTDAGLNSIPVGDTLVYHLLWNRLP